MSAAETIFRAVVLLLGAMSLIFSYVSKDKHPNWEVTPFIWILLGAFLIVGATQGVR